ncbi:hypothetical protein EKO27_g2468 [Xylaria grammica]|uniref:ABC transporter domain-containing protein n=1 Tax=Xylaria grammica TaxID=363999 RepID=A0A439DE47_9PEZI|nr:hypothetical protein EKO27_g2468 [Xylaria grammica]
MQEPLGQLPVLTKAEKLILETQQHGLQTAINKKARTVLTYATVADKIILILGCLSSIIRGALNPLLTLKSEMARFALYYVYLAIGLFVFIYMATVIFSIYGERVTQRLRLDYFKAVLSQNLAFFNVLGPGQVTSGLTLDSLVLQSAIARRVSLTLTATATFIAAFVIIFAEYWKLALVLLSTAVAMTAVNTIGTRSAIHHNKRALEARAQGNALAHEALRSYRHVAASGIHEDLADKYSNFLVLERSQSLRARFAIAFMIAAFMGIMYLSSGLAFWQGSRLLLNGEMTAAEIVTCSMAIIIAARAIRNVAPNSNAFVTGMAGANKLLETIKRQSSQNPFDSSGDRLREVQGEIALKSVRLAYPSRPDTLALDGVDILFPAGKMTAVIGASGCGKSSIISLIERFYEPVSSSIMRTAANEQQMSLVSQEPVLFKASIFENIRHGLIGRDQLAHDEVEARKLVIQAAKTANAHEFIKALSRGYETEIGELGAQLSGGQRQRIAIARAIVNNPKVLLLDEATAALDTRSERLVLDALERASAGRTTIFITHRLSSRLELMKHFAASGGIYSTSLAQQGILAEEWIAGDYNVSLVDDSSAEITAVHASNEASLSLEKQSNDEKNRQPDIIPEVEMTSKQYPLWSLVKMASALGRPERPQAVIGLAGQGALLAYCSESLTSRARERAFRSLLRQDAGFFDRPRHTTGALMSILSTSATQLAGLGGAVLSAILTAFASIAGGIILSLIIGFKLALVCTATIPVVLGCGWLRLRAMSAREATMRASGLDSVAYATEAITAVRTVSTLCLEGHVLTTYESMSARAAAQSLRSIFYTAALYAASQSAVQLVAALAFCYGGTLIADEGYTLLQYFVCFAALVSGSQAVGAIFSFAPDISKARYGGQDFKRLFDERPVIDIWNRDGAVLTDCRVSIKLDGVSFRYPSRPESYALNDFSIEVHPGQTVALVGPSGCGKSTVLSLLERFYDPSSGAVFIDGIDLRQLNLAKYRALVSLVGQEPVLYQGSIRENLLLGTGRETVSEQEIETACRQANILDFVQSLPCSFSTEVGSAGVMLSGGQKQRIAIARALLRNTPILLLDEATSALDRYSEAAVQLALDVASRNRTTIIVAHKLQTVRNANVIYVVEQGTLVKQSSHNNLMRLRGKYAKLVELQSLEEAVKAPGLR